MGPNLDREQVSSMFHKSPNNKFIWVADLTIIWSQNFTMRENIIMVIKIFYWKYKDTKITESLTGEGKQTYASNGIWVALMTAQDMKR